MKKGLDLTSLQVTRLLLTLSIVSTIMTFSAIFVAIPKCYRKEVPVSSNDSLKTPIATPDISPNNEVLISDANLEYKLDHWLTFNQDFQSPHRRFRFKYPSTFEVLDQESDALWLKKGHTDYLVIDEDVTVEGFIQFNHLEEKSALEQFEEYYSLYDPYASYDPQTQFDLKSADGTPPTFHQFDDTLTRKDFGSNRFVYIRKEQVPNGQLFGGQRQYIHYFGVLDGHGIDIYNLKQLPESLVIELIQSIDFQSR